MSEALGESFENLLEMLTDFQAGRHSLVDVRRCIASLRRLLQRHRELDRAERALQELAHAESELDSGRFSMVRQHIEMARDAVA